MQWSDIDGEKSRQSMAMVRLTLGLLQMAGAAFSLALLIWTGHQSVFHIVGLDYHPFDLFECLAFRKQINKFSGFPEKREGPVMSKARVLFLCTANSCRSQMAEGFLRHMAGDRFEVTSAGTTPDETQPGRSPGHGRGRN